MRDSGLSRVQEKVQEQVQAWLDALTPLEVAGLLAAALLVLYLGVMTVMFALAAAAANRRPQRRRRRPLGHVHHQRPTLAARAPRPRYETTRRAA